MLSLHLLACVHWRPLAPTSLEAAVQCKQNTPVVFGHLLLSALSSPWPLSSSPQILVALEKGCHKPQILEEKGITCAFTP